MNTHSQRFHNKIYSIELKLPVYRGDKWLKIHQNSSMLMTLCRQKVTKQGKMRRFELKIVLLQYLRSMNVFPAETVTTRLQLQFQHSFLRYVPCHDATSWNWSKTEIIKVSWPWVLKWGITGPKLNNQNLQTLRYPIATGLKIFSKTNPFLDIALINTIANKMLCSYQINFNEVGLPIWPEA